TATRSATTAAAEGKAVAALFGERVPRQFDQRRHRLHVLAAGAVEAVICALALKHDLLFGSPNTATLDPTLRLTTSRLRGQDACAAC
ncbi:MAG: beta-ketoacyl-[acyl-carrier-protein] synthase II, partial [Comamonadaceae bacterium]|nr:beta-ketoacyl-[acyl-carrier-protein] synthase II [Comamonadaceae bacterium]